jgi:hypothetical protein
MSDPFLRFENSRIQIGGKNIMANSANLSISPKLTEEKVYGRTDLSICGAPTQFVEFSPVGMLQGQLEINFYISAETFLINKNPNSIEKMFEIKAGMSDNPIDDNIVGRYKFDGMFLKSFSFTLAPFQNLIATAVYDIYGTIKRYEEAIDRFSQPVVDFAHGLQSFGNVKISGASAASAIVRQFEISNLKYNINVTRKVHSHIRDNEHTSVNTRSEGATPYRITAENITSEMNIESNELIPNLNPYGDQQNGSTPFGLKNSTITAYLYGLTGEQVTKFSTSGKIHTQSLEVSEGSYAKGSMTIKEVIK